MIDQAARLRQIVENKAEINPMHLANSTARVMAITSGKGGVGKTNLAVNLAIALRRLKQRVLIIDADIGMANVDVILGSRSKKHLLNLLDYDTNLDDILQEGPYGIKYISGGSGIEKAIDFSYEERNLLMQKLADCGKIADIILVDTGAGLGKNVMDFILAADEVLLITTPEPTALTDAYAIMKAYSLYARHKNIKLIINRVYDVGESREVATKLSQTSERFLGMKIDCLGYIYEDAAVRHAVRKQTPLMMYKPSSTAAKCVQELANGVVFGSKMTVKRGWKEFLQQIFNFPR